MIPGIRNEIIEYVSNHSHPPSEILSDLSAKVLKIDKNFDWQIDHVEGGLLRLLVRLTQAKHILEIGTYYGYSALCMAECMPDDGKLITIDSDPEPTKVAIEYWSRSPHGKKIELRLGRASDVLKNLEGPFDLVFIDANKRRYPFYWEKCVPKVRPGGVIVADNVLWEGNILNPKAPSDVGIAEFNHRVRTDPRVEAVMLTVRDGITIAWKKP